MCSVEPEFRQENVHGQFEKDFPGSIPGIVPVETVVIKIQAIPQEFIERTTYPKRHSQHIHRS